MLKLLFQLVFVGLMMCACAQSKGDDIDKMFRESAEKSQKAKFRGLDGFDLSVIAVEGGGPDDPLTTEELRRLVELRLRANRVRFLDALAVIRATRTDQLESKIEELKKLKLARLCVAVSLLKTRDDVYVYSILIEVRENARLARDPELSVVGQVYQESRLGYGGQLVIRDRLRQIVENGIDELSNVFLKSKEE